MDWAFDEIQREEPALVAFDHERGHGVVEAALALVAALTRHRRAVMCEVNEDDDPLSDAAFVRLVSDVAALLHSHSTMTQMQRAERFHAAITADLPPPVRIYHNHRGFAAATDNDDDGEATGAALETETAERWRALIEHERRVGVIRGARLVCLIGTGWPPHNVDRWLGAGERVDTVTVRYTPPPRPLPPGAHPLDEAVVARRRLEAEVVRGALRQLCFNVSSLHLDEYALLHVDVFAVAARAHVPARADEGRPLEVRLALCAMAPQAPQAPTAPEALQPEILAVPAAAPPIEPAAAPPEDLVTL